MTDNEKCIVTKPELCINCHACEQACRNWRGAEDGKARRYIVTVERGKYPDTAITYVPVQCMRCVEPNCRDCEFGILKEQGGTKIFKCDMCRDASCEEEKYPCVRMCPTGAITIKELTIKERIEEENRMRNNLRR